MLPEIETLLIDMRDACIAIDAFLVGKSFKDFASDDLLRSGVYFKFVVIGEALTRIRELDESVHDAITESWRITGFRNQIVHGYAQIRDEITWRIIETKLPVLKSELDELLKGA